MWTRILPEVFSRTDTLEDVALGSLNFQNFDRQGAPLRLRLASTAVHIRHDGDPATAGSVLVTYVREGKLHRIRAKAVVLGTGGWVNRNIVGDLPPANVEALKFVIKTAKAGPGDESDQAMEEWPIPHR